MNGNSPQSTEGDGGPAPTPVPSGDNNPNIQPTAAVILPTPLPTLTPWVYPAPVQPTQPPPQVESPCAHIEGDIVWVEVHGAGLTPKCFSIYSWQRIGVVSLLDAPVQVTLEDTSMQLAARARSEFSEPVASMLTPGMHLLRADPYGSVEVWLVVR